MSVSPTTLVTPAQAMESLRKLTRDVREVQVTLDQLQGLIQQELKKREFEGKYLRALLAPPFIVEVPSLATFVAIRAWGNVVGRSDSQIADQVRALVTTLYPIRGELALFGITRPTENTETAATITQDATEIVKRGVQYNRELTPEQHASLPRVLQHQLLKKSLLST